MLGFKNLLDTSGILSSLDTFGNSIMNWTWIPLSSSLSTAHPTCEALCVFIQYHSLDFQTNKTKDLNSFPVSQRASDEVLRSNWSRKEGEGNPIWLTSPSVHIINLEWKPTLWWVFPTLAAPQSLQDFSSRTKDQTQDPGSEVRAQSPNHWTGREFFVVAFLRQGNNLQSFPKWIQQCQPQWDSFSITWKTPTTNNPQH